MASRSQPSGGGPADRSTGLNAEPSARAFTLDTSGVVPCNVTPRMTTFSAWRWSDLPPFAQGYVEALLRDLAARKAWPCNVTAFTSRDDGAHFSQLFAFRKIAPEALAAILKDCEARFTGWVTHPNNSYVRADDRTEGERFWRDRQRGGCKDFPPQTFTLGDDGKVYLALSAATGTGIGGGE